MKTKVNDLRENLKIELSTARKAYEKAGKDVETAYTVLNESRKAYDESFTAAEAAGVSIF